MPADQYPEGVRLTDHIAHDMKAGRFPERSSVETFLAERSAALLDQSAERGDDRIRRELAGIERELSKAMDAWEPPTARDVMRELARVVSVLQFIYQEHDND